MRHLTGVLICFGLLTSMMVFPSSVGKAEEAKKPEMKRYTVELRNTDVKFEMLPIPGGVFKMGSPKTEVDHLKDESPVHEVKIEPFWMAKCEVTWNEYNVYREKLDSKRRKLKEIKPTAQDIKADAITRPTAEWIDRSFGMGIDGFPAITVTQLAAKTYCVWLTELTGDYYRLPTEAEWEYACRAGTTTAYSFGDDPDKLGEYAWYYENSDDKYHKVGKKKPNPWGLHDMHGNVAEWCLDQYIPDYYSKMDQEKPAIFPVAVPTKLYPRVVRGGSWEDDPELLRSASRQKSDPVWKIRDPQLPKSMWYTTDSLHVGFRIVRPFKRPTEEEIKKYVLYPDVPKELIRPKPDNKKKKK